MSADPHVCPEDRGARPGQRRGPRDAARRLVARGVERPGYAILAVGAAVSLVASLLELANVGNAWLLSKDISCFVVPMAAALAMTCAAFSGERQYRAGNLGLAASIGLAGVGQLVIDVADAMGRPLGQLFVVADAAFMVSAMIAIMTIMGSLYRRLEDDARRAVVLDGLIVMAASMTLVFANWLQQVQLANGLVGNLLDNRTSDLLGPLVLAAFFASAFVEVVAALWLKVKLECRSVWAVSVGMVLLAVAWNEWFARHLAGIPDGIAAMDFLFPAGALIAGFGGLTWSLRPDSSASYERYARILSDWMPIVAIIICAFLDVMPRTRPLMVDPIAVGTCSVMLLVVARQRVLQGRERSASRRLTSEMTERAATAVSMVRLESGETIETTADLICAEALGIEGIDAVALFVFGPNGVVPIAQRGPAARSIAIGKPLPASSGRELKEHAEFGLWLESWTGRVARDDFDRVTIASGLRAEALAPLVWNGETIGVLSMGAVSVENERHLADRLPTLTEFTVMSAAVLGPKLSERWSRDVLRAEVQSVINARAFHPVFQPVVDLNSRACVGYEALTRFDDGVRPDLRFMAAERVGMMVDLEKACLDVQIQQARSLPAGRFVSLNVSPALAMMRDPLLEIVASVDRAVVLEVTEHTEIEDYTALTAALDEVRPYTMLAVDDAGAGYAGLRHILELRPQFVKLDISLVRNIDHDPARQAMVTGMTRFAETVGCSLIAEGIETENELTALKLLNIQYGQGYFLARPARVETFAVAVPAVPVATMGSATTASRKTRVPDQDGGAGSADESSPAKPARRARRPRAAA